MEFSKKKLLSILEQVNALDVDEMAMRRPLGVQKRNPNKPDTSITGWRDDNPTPKGKYGIPDYWILNPNKIPGEEQIFVPTTCEETHKFIEENKEWLDSLGILHDIQSSPQVVYCKRVPETHSGAKGQFLGMKYQPTGKKMKGGERMKRYSNRKKNDGFNEIINKYIVNSDIAQHLKTCNVPPIVNERNHRDNYSLDEANNKSITFRMISFLLFKDKPQFLRATIENIRKLANFNIPRQNDTEMDSGQVQYLARLFSRIYKNWSITEKTKDDSFIEYTDKYKLKRLGYQTLGDKTDDDIDFQRKHEENIDLLISTSFEILGKLLDSSYVWTISMSVKYGEKLKQVTDEGNQIKDKIIRNLVEDKNVTTSKTINLDREIVKKLLNADLVNEKPENEITPEDEQIMMLTIMDIEPIKNGLKQTIEDFKSKLKQEITPEDALRLGRITYGKSINENKISKIIKEIIKESKK